MAQQQDGNIDAYAAYSEASALNQWYHDRNLKLAHANVILIREKTALENERDGLLLKLSEMQKELEVKNGGS